MRLLIAALLVFMPFFNYAQKERRTIDSLLLELPKAHDDTSKVKLLNDLCAGYHTVDPLSGIRYGEQGLELAGTLDWKPGIADACLTLGMNYQYRSDYPRAMEYYFKSLRIYEEMRNKIEEARVLRNIASVYQYEKNFAKVLEYNLKALKIFEDMGDKEGLSSSLSNIGIFYFSQHDYTKALEYDFKALKICEELNVRTGIASNESNVGDAYKFLGEYARALEYSFRSLKLFEELGDKYGIAIDLGNIGEAYLAIAKDTAHRIKPDGIIPSGRQANLYKAIEYLEKSIAASKEIDQLDNIIEFDQYLADAYELAGNYKAALERFRQYSKVNDSVYSAANSLKIKNEEHVHDLELKDRDLQIAHLALSKRRSERIFFIGGIFILLLVIVVILRNYSTQTKTNKLLSKANLLLSDEKKRSDDLLRNILPAEVAEELKATGSAVARHFDHVTVMFTDFVNFTQAGERMNPQQLIEELHTCFKAFDDIIGKHNIEKIKTIGDAYLAVSGLPVKDPAHAAHIVSAAIDINTYMTNRKRQMGDQTFEVRIGIHSGSVVAGIVGVKKFAYDIWGDTVNTASRMEENSEAGKINISQMTYEMVKDEFVCSYRGKIQAKNKGEMRMYFVEGPVKSRS